jgi:hypothetical protein
MSYNRSCLIDDKCSVQGKPDFNQTVTVARNDIWMNYILTLSIREDST